MIKLFFKYYFFIVLVVLIGCSEQNDSKDLKLEVEHLKHENDSLNQLLQNSQTSAGKVSYDTLLSGTTFLPYSSKMIGLLNKGLEPIDFLIIEECKAKDFENDQYPKFIDIRRTSSTLIVDVTIIANCCHNFLGEAEVVGDDTLNLVYTDYGGFCSWGPCTLRYVFDTTLEKEYQILKYVTINGSETIGLIPNE